MLDTAKRFSSDCEDLGLATSRYPKLIAAMNFSDEKVKLARQALGDLSDRGLTDIVAFGSMARREMTSESDFDYLVVSYGLDSPGTARDALTRADGLRMKLGVGDKALAEPGSSGVFAKIVSATEMVEVIGLQGDTNHSQTRRILLLEESVSLTGNTEHENLIGSIVHRYLEAQKVGSGRVPRFLLNDIVKYWRTITVDYQAKTPRDTPYSLRYLKLILSRKIAFFAALVPLIMGEQVAEQQEFLTQSYMDPSVLRLTALARFLRDSDEDHVESVAGILDDLEIFVAWSGDAGWREAIREECKKNEQGQMETFESARQIGRDLNAKLTRLFMSDPINKFTERYLLF